MPAEWLPRVPAVDPGTPLGGFLRGLGSGRFAVPPLDGLGRIDLVRWLYRAWVADHDGPLVHVDLRRVGGNAEILAEARSVARGGWLYLEGGETTVDTSDVVVITDAAVPPLPVDPQVAEAIRALDGAHLAAVDPTLAGLRRSLASHARSASVVSLVGPAGAGKRSLVRHVHGTLDDRPLSVIRRGGDRRETVGQWQLYEEVGDLDETRAHGLRVQLQPVPPRATGAALGNRPDSTAFRPILGRSAPLAAVLHQAARAAPSRLPVLILGETGTGKEALARAIHDASGRAGPYVTVDIASLSDEIVESELFGHRKGAFTGAERDRAGAFRTADGGTLFLDELGNISLRLQAKLLRVLQEGVIHPVGEDRPVRVDVRVVAATNLDLEGAVLRREFREDLLRRLDAVTLRLPPLVERGADILHLARAFAGPAGLTEAAGAALQSWHWPGNVRELQNVIARARIEAGDRPIDAGDLGALDPSRRRPVPVFATSSDPDAAPPGFDRPLLRQLRAVTLTVPGLADRGPRAVRSAILALLDGRPIRLDALLALEQRAWPGNLAEIAAAMTAVRANLPGVVDLAALQRVLPHLVPAAGMEPIRALLHPFREPEGGVGGLRETFLDEGVIIGRANSLEGAAGADGRRASAIREILRGGSPGWLPLPGLARLSRAHVLVARGRDGLTVHPIPGTRLPTLAGPLVPGAPLSPVVDPVAIGRAGEIRVRSGEATYLQAFLFLGDAAWEEDAPLAVDRAEEVGAAAAFLATLASIATDGPPRQAAPWILDPGEREELAALVARFAGGDFKAHLEREAPVLGSRRLAGYLLGPRPTQYCARLFELEGNEALGDAVARRLEGPDVERRVALLPLGIQRALKPHR